MLHAEVNFPLYLPISYGVISSSSHPALFFRWASSTIETYLYHRHNCANDIHMLPHFCVIFDMPRVDDVPRVGGNWHQLNKWKSPNITRWQMSTLLCHTIFLKSYDIPPKRARNCPADDNMERSGLDTIKTFEFFGSLDRCGAWTIPTRSSDQFSNRINSKLHRLFGFLYIYSYQAIYKII